jgi:hypothetical protein
VRGKNGRILLDRPKPTAGCSAKGRRRNIFKIVGVLANESRSRKKDIHRATNKIVLRSFLCVDSSHIRTPPRSKGKSCPKFSTLTFKDR